MIIAISSPPPIETKGLAKKLAKQHGLKIIENPAPQLCQQYGFQTLYDMPFGLQSEIREKLIYEHAEFVKSNENVLLNFSVMEFLADWMRWFWATTPTEQWENLLIAGNKAAACYDKIYHIEEGELKDYDGYVWFDKRNCNQINNLLKYLYSEMNCSDKIKLC